MLLHAHDLPAAAGFSAREAARRNTGHARPEKLAAASRSLTRCAGFEMTAGLSFLVGRGLPLARHVADLPLMNTGLTKPMR